MTRFDLAYSMCQGFMTNQHKYGFIVPCSMKVAQATVHSPTLRLQFSNPTKQKITVHTSGTVKLSTSKTLTIFIRFIVMIQNLSSQKTAIEVSSWKISQMLININIAFHVVITAHFRCTKRELRSRAFFMFRDVVENIRNNFIYLTLINLKKTIVRYHNYTKVVR